LSGKSPVSKKALVTHPCNQQVPFFDRKRLRVYANW